MTKCYIELGDRVRVPTTKSGYLPPTLSVSDSRASLLPDPKSPICTLQVIGWRFDSCFEKVYLLEIPNNPNENNLELRYNQHQTPAMC